MVTVPLAPVRVTVSSLGELLGELHALSGCRLAPVGRHFVRLIASHVVHDLRVMFRADIGDLGCEICFPPPCSSPFSLTEVVASCSISCCLSTFTAVVKMTSAAIVGRPRRAIVLCGVSTLC